MKSTSLFARCFLIVATIAFIGASPAPEDPAKTAQFQAFFTTILAGQVPTKGVTPQMAQGFAPALVAQIDDNLAPFGKFQKLQYVSEDSVPGYDRYHYTAIFDKGSRNFLFVLDSSGNIAGFFRDE
ncbi:MAG TPA: hypothetical protein VGG89_15405 [Candidatus Baltobacteraceae bacterium]|jgi:hypothetical protein